MNEDIINSVSNQQEKLLINTAEIISQNTNLLDVKKIESVTQNLPQQAFKLFPQSLESSGYVILTVVLLIFCFFFFFMMLTIYNGIHSTQKSIEILKEVSISLFISQKTLEYKLLLDELNKSSNADDHLNAKIQIWNFLNKISREICESKNEKLAYSLGSVFFSKILGRYLKMGTSPEGVVYFRVVGELLMHFGSMYNDEMLVKKIRSEYKRGVVSYQQVQKEFSKNKKI
ncbi:MAG: hypothetical protein ACRCTQ_05095 [Brevinemataceae bacterium]